MKLKNEEKKTFSTKPPSVQFKVVIREFASVGDISVHHEIIVIILLFLYVE